jgi:hypothetical protein
MKRHYVVNFIKAIFARFQKKNAAYFAAARAERLSTFIKLQDDLKSDNDEIQTLILNKQKELDEIRSLIGGLEKTKAENGNTISQIAKFV